MFSHHTNVTVFGTFTHNWPSVVFFFFRKFFISNYNDSGVKKRKLETIQRYCCWSFFSAGLFVSINEFEIDRRKKTGREKVRTNLYLLRQLKMFHMEKKTRINWKCSDISNQLPNGIASEKVYEIIINQTFEKTMKRFLSFHWGIDWIPFVLAGVKSMRRRRGSVRNVIGSRRIRANHLHTRV